MIVRSGGKGEKKQVPHRSRRKNYFSAEEQFGQQYFFKNPKP